MPYSTGVSSTMLLICVLLHWGFFCSCGLHCFVEIKNVITKQIPIKVKSFSCLVQSVKITVHIVTYYATDATAKCKAEGSAAHGLGITCPPICFDLSGMSPRRVNTRDDISSGSIMTHLLFPWRQFGDNSDR